MRKLILLIVVGLALGALSLGLTPSPSVIALVCVECIVQHLISKVKSI